MLLTHPTQLRETLATITPSHAASARAELLAILKGYEHLLCEPVGQVDYDGLRALYADWVDRLGDSPEAIAICDALDDFIDTNVEEGDAERAYFDLMATAQQGGA